MYRAAAEASIDLLDLAGPEADMRRLLHELQSEHSKIKVNSEGACMGVHIGACMQRVCTYAA